MRDMLMNAFEMDKKKAKTLHDENRSTLPTDVFCGDWAERGYRTIMSSENGFTDDSGLRFKKSIFEHTLPQPNKNAAIKDFLQTICLTIKGNSKNRVPLDFVQIQNEINRQFP